MTRRTKIIYGVAGGLLAFFVLGALLATALFPAERVRSLAEQTISKAVGMPVRIGSLGLSFRGIPSIRATEITIGPARPGEPALAAVKSVRVRAGLLPLLRRQVDITSVVIEEPLITLVTRADSTTNLPAPADTARVKTPGKPSLPVPVSLRSFRIVDGSVLIINENEGSRVALNDLSQRLSLRVSRDLETMKSDGVLEVGSIDLWSKGKRQPISGSTLRLTHDVTGNVAAGNITLTDGELALNGIPVKLNGEMKEWKNATFHAETGTLGADKLVSAVPDSMLPFKKDITAKGDISLVMDGSAILTDPKPVLQYRGELDIREMTASVRGFPKRIDRLNGAVGITDQTLELRNIEILIEQSRMALSGTISNYLKKPELAVRTQGMINLEDVTSALPLFKENKPAGTASFDLAVNGSPEPDVTALKPSGELTMSNLTMSLPKALKNPATLNGTIRISPEMVGLPGLQFKSGKSDLTITGGLTNYLSILPERRGDPATLTGAISSTLLDLNDLLVTPKDAPLLKPWDLDEPLKNLPVPPALRAEAGIKLNTVLFGRLKADSVQGTVSLNKGVMELSKLNVAAYNGALTGKATVNFSNPEQVVYSGGFDLTKLNAQTFITSFFGTGDHFRGLFSTSLTFNGAGLDSLSFFKNLKANGSGSFENGQVVNWEFMKQLGQRLRFLNFDTIDFQKIAGAYRVEDNRVITPNLAATTEYGDITAVGSTGFDGSVDHTILLDLNQRAVDLAAKNKLGDLAGIISSSQNPELKVVATGTLKKPSFKIDATSIRENVKEQLRDEAEKLLKGEDSDLQQKGRKLIDKLFK